MDHHAVGQLLDLDAERAQHSRHGRDAIGLLHAQLAGVANLGRALRGRGRDAENRELVDRAQQALAGDPGGAQRTALDHECRARLAVGVALVLDRDRGTHRREDVENPAPRRVDTNVRHAHPRARHEQRGDEKEGGRREVAGERDVGGGELLRPANPTVRSARISVTPKRASSRSV